jgi:hypothetical protein
MRQPDDERLFGAMDQAVARLIESGVPESDAMDKLSSEMIKVLTTEGAKVADVMMETAGEVIAEERELSQAFDRKLRDLWGGAFDAFYLAGYAIAECADRFATQNYVDSQHDDVFQALRLLHERGRRVLWEVHRLLTGGFPGGAAARARTLHEIAVTAAVIGEHGRTPGSDLATRYLHHETVGLLRHVRADLALARQLGDTVSAEGLAELRRLERRVAELKRQYGREFGDPEGWAAPLVPLLPQRRHRLSTPTIADLERLADQTHMRSAYGWMSAEVHAGAMGLHLNVDPLDDSESLIGPTTVGLAAPGRLALESLRQLTWALLTLGIDDEQTSFDDLLALKVLEQFMIRYSRAADAAEMAVEEDSRMSSTAVVETAVDTAAPLDTWA